jgi:type I restriction enzyme, S subunit
MKLVLRSKFKETIVGKIPIDWRIGTLNDISSITDGSHRSPKFVAEGSKIIATVKDMRYNRFDFSKCKRISDSDFDTLIKNGCSPDKGDILISKDGSEVISH